MNKKFVIISVLLIVALSTGIAFADGFDEPVTEEIIPEYVDAISVSSTMSLSGANATCYSTVTVKPSSNANEVVFTVNYLKTGSGSVGTKTVTAYRSNNAFAPMWISNMATPRDPTSQLQERPCRT